MYRLRTLYRHGTHHDPRDGGNHFPGEIRQRDAVLDEMQPDEFAHVEADQEGAFLEGHIVFEVQGQGFEPFQGLHLDGVALVLHDMGSDEGFELAREDAEHLELLDVIYFPDGDAVESRYGDTEIEVEREQLEDFHEGDIFHLAFVHLLADEITIIIDIVHG